MTDVDWSDPCQRASALTIAYYALLSGESVTEVRSRTLDAEELVRYTKADLPRLTIEMRAAQSACAVSRGLPDPNRRFAIAAGGRSDIPSYNRDRRPI